MLNIEIIPFPQDKEYPYIQEISFSTGKEIDTNIPLNFQAEWLDGLFNRAGVKIWQEMTVLIKSSRYTGMAEVWSLKQSIEKGYNCFGQMEASKNSNKTACPIELICEYHNINRHIIYDAYLVALTFIQNSEFFEKIDRQPISNDGVRGPIITDLTDFLKRLGEGERTAKLVEEKLFLNQESIELLGEIARLHYIYSSAFRHFIYKDKELPDYPSIYVVDNYPGEPPKFSFIRRKHDLRQIVSGLNNFLADTKVFEGLE